MLFYVYEYFASMYACVPGAPRDQKRMLKLELWTAVTYTALRCYVSDGKNIWDLFKQLKSVLLAAKLSFQNTFF